MMKKYDKIKFVPSKKIASNHQYSLVINDYGDLYSWGNNEGSKQGHQIDNEETFDIISQPRKFPFFTVNNQRLIDVSCGDNHIAIVAINKEENGEAGTIYTWGLSFCGRLGYIEAKSGNIMNLKMIEKKGESIKGEFEYKLIPHPVHLPEKVARVACGCDFNAAITINGKLYTWGSNSDNYLGIDSRDIKIPFVTTPMLVTTLATKDCIQIACGSKHMIALTSEGNVYTWGAGSNGVLGHGSNNSYDKPEIINEFKESHDMIFIAAGLFSSAAISSRGELYTWGRGKFGVLGLGTEEDIIFPRLVSGDLLQNEEIFYVSLGSYHALALGIHKKAFAWGYSEKGRLGCIEKADCEQKKRIIIPKEISELNGKTLTQVFAGHYHSFAIAADTRKLYGWGENVESILGLGLKKKSHKVETYYFPIELPSNRSLIQIGGSDQSLYDTYFNFGKVNIKNEFLNKTKLSKIACGSTHSIGLTFDGDVFTWGFGEDGQLGLKEDNKIVQQPMRVTSNLHQKIKKVYAGYNNSMAITIKGECYAWGNGVNGQLCKHISSINEPMLLDFFLGMEVSKGCLGYDSCAVIIEGKLYMWGCNDNGKLGLDKDDQIIYLPELVNIDPVKSISCGSEHTAAITIGHDLYTWGQGFFGQLGTGDKFSSSFPQKIVCSESKFSKVKCGSVHTCAIGKKGNIFIWGKSKYNLFNDNDQDIIIPKQIDFFNKDKAKKVQVGFGNTFVLLFNKTVWGWGDNNDYKVSSDKRKIITGKPIQLKVDSLKESKFVDIFIGYDHCYAITLTGDLYGWGTSSSFRLTSDYGDIQLKEPKLLKLFSRANVDFNPNDELKSNDSSDNKAPKSSALLAERNYISRINEKYAVPLFDELMMLIRTQNQKYDEVLIDKADENMNAMLIEKFEKNKLLHSSNKPPNVINQLRYHQLLHVRMESIAPITSLPSTKSKNTMIPIDKTLPELPIEFKEGIDEIQKLYTLFCLHPCLFKQFFITNNYSSFVKFFNGIQPLFKDIGSYNPKSINYDIIIYLTYAKMILKSEVEMLIEQRKHLETSTNLYSFSNIIDKLYLKPNSRSELLFDIFFQNYYDKSILIDIFKKSLDIIKQESLALMKMIKATNGSIEHTSLNEYFNRLKILFSADTLSIDTETLMKSKDIEKINNIMRIFINDYEANATLFPPQIAYMLTYLARKYYNLFIIYDNHIALNDSDIKKIKKMIKNALMRLFCKNVLSRKFKIICADHSFMNSDFGFQGNSSLQQCIQNYIMIIGEYFDKIICNTKFQSINTTIQGNDKKKKNDKGKKRKEFNVFKETNYLMKDYHDKIYKIFNQNFLKDEWELKGEIVSSLLYHNNTTKVKKVRISIGNIMDFLGEIVHNSSNKTIPFNIENYLIFNNLFEKDKSNNVKPINLNHSMKINLFIDTKFLLEPEVYCNLFEMEFSSINTSLARCNQCQFILPSKFIDTKPSKTLIKTLKDKTEGFKDNYSYVTLACQLLKDKSFHDKYILTLTHSSAITSLFLFIEKLNEVIAHKALSKIPLWMTLNESIEGYYAKESHYDIKEDTDPRSFKLFRTMIFKHLRNIVNHHTLLMKYAKVLNDIDTSQEDYIQLVSKENKIIETSLLNIGQLKDCIEFLSYNTQLVNVKLSELTMKKKLNKRLVLYNEKSNHTFTMIEMTFRELEERKILLHVEKKDIMENLFHFNANATISIFEISVMKAIGKDIANKYELPFQLFLYYILHSDCHTVIRFPGIGKFDFNKFLKLINQHICIENIDYDNHNNK